MNARTMARIWRRIRSVVREDSTDSKEVIGQVGRGALGRASKVGEVLNQAKKAASNLADATEVTKGMQSGGAASAVRAGMTPFGSPWKGLLADPSLRSAFGTAFSGRPKGWFSELSHKMLALANQAAKKGASPIPFKKTLAFGGGATALAIATALSDPPVTRGPAPRVQPMLQSGTGGARLQSNLHPRVEVEGEPQAPSPLAHANTGRIMSQPTAARRQQHRLAVRGQMPDGVDMGALSDQLQAAMGGNALVSSSISDRRSSLTPQRISDILSRG